MADALRSAGALMVGKASTHEIGIGTTGLNVAAGQVKGIERSGIPPFHMRAP